MDSPEHQAQDLARPGTLHGLSCRGTACHRRAGDRTCVNRPTPREEYPGAEGGVDRHGAAQTQKEDGGGSTQRLEWFYVVGDANSAEKTYAYHTFYALEGSSARSLGAASRHPSNPRRHQSPPTVDSIQGCDGWRWGMVKFTQGRSHDGPWLKTS
jgi:hypothetical protein